MILTGKYGLSNDTNPYFNQSVIAISQLIYFNLAKRTPKETKTNYHTEDREPPIACYIGQQIYAHIRKTDTILEKLSHLGICISSNHLNQISTTIGNTAIDTFEQEHVVYPLEMTKGFSLLVPLTT